MTSLFSEYKWRDKPMADSVSGNPVRAVLTEAVEMRDGTLCFHFDLISAKSATGRDCFRGGNCSALSSPGLPGLCHLLRVVGNSIPLPYKGRGGLPGNQQAVAGNLPQIRSVCSEHRDDYHKELFMALQCSIVSELVWIRLWTFKRLLDFDK